MNEQRRVLISGPTMPKHPWKEGLWIFPEDHPLSRYERAEHAKKLKALKKPPKELMPGDSDDS